jgi:hypothetical protein
MFKNRWEEETFEQASKEREKEVIRATGFEPVTIRCLHDATVENSAPELSSDTIL